MPGDRRISTARERGRLAPLKFEHAGLRTNNLPRLVEWYAKVLEADVAFENGAIAFLCYDEQNHRLAILARPGTVERQPNAAGLDHLAFTYADFSELAATYQRLNAEGIRPARAMDHGSSTSLYYVDPDGNQVELKVDNFATVEEQHAWMQSDAFASNPIGAPFDPESIFARFRAGEPPSQLTGPGAVGS
jgi:catechol-2,3-dioxygenase